MLETTYDDQGVITKQISYVVGLDNISQTITDGSGASAQVFTRDGRGSVRVLYDLTAALVTAAGVQQVYMYNAFGNAVGFDPNTAITSLQFQGGVHDVFSGLDYRNARWATNGRFLSLDPYFGNQGTPWSFNKYAIAHGDLINFNDPTGLFEGGLNGQMSTMMSGSQIASSSAGAAIRVGVSFVQRYGLQVAAGYAGVRLGLMQLGTYELNNLDYTVYTTPLSHTHHTFKLMYPSGTNMTAKADEIYGDLKTFQWFNNGHNDVANVYPADHGNEHYVLFDDKGWLGTLGIVINPDAVPVRVWSSQSQRTVVGDTAGWHMLIGQRRWSVTIDSNQILRVDTESYDRPRDTLNSIGLFFMGRDLQMAVWTQYFQNMVDHYVEQGAQVVQQVTYDYQDLGQVENPWKPVKPYPGMDAP